MSGAPIRVVYVLAEPTPYQAPLIDLIAARPEIDLFAVYSGSSLVNRTWTVALRHPHLVLAGRRLPLPKGLLPHDYPVDFAIWRLLGERRPDVVVASGWSTFASQAAIAWARLHRVPYLLATESHGLESRTAWRRALKRLVVPRLQDHAASVFVSGRLAREQALVYGVPAARAVTFGTTIDVTLFGERVDALRPERAALRARLGVGDEELLVLCVGRLIDEKGLDTLVEAVAAVPSCRLVVAGEGPNRVALECGKPVTLLGHVEGDALFEVYAAADVFALLSRREGWAVVVNEAAAAGLPLVLSDRVGAAFDLLRPGENGELVPVDDPAAAAAALRRLALDPALRERYGARSREIVADWGYEANVEHFVGAVRTAVGLPA